MLGFITKVGKAMKTAEPFRGRNRGRENRASVRCHACGQFEHYQQFCNFRQADNPPKRARFVGGLYKQSETDSRV